MSFSIEGKTAIVTGAANGIGLAIARHFVDAGANVMLADMDETKLMQEADAIVGDKDQSQAFAGDLREKLTIANLLSATISAFDRVDILVNASRQVGCSNPLDPKTDAFTEMLNQNVIANLRLSQYVAKRMIQQATDDPVEGAIGAIVNLSSIASRRTQPELMAYSVSCAALDQMTRSLAVSLAPSRIRVNAVAIGSIMSASLQSSLKEQPDLREALAEVTPLGRIGDAREIAETVQFLASDGASFVTGQIITVDGGRTLIDPMDKPVH